MRLQKCWSKLIQYPIKSYHLSRRLLKVMKSSSPLHRVGTKIHTAHTYNTGNLFSNNKFDVFHCVHAKYSVLFRGSDLMRSFGINNNNEFCFPRCDLMFESNIKFSLYFLYIQNSVTFEMHPFYWVWLFIITSGPNMFHLSPPDRLHLWPDQNTRLLFKSLALRVLTQWTLNNSIDRTCDTSIVGAYLSAKIFVFDLACVLVQSNLNVCVFNYRATCMYNISVVLMHALVCACMFTPLLNYYIMF